MPREALAKCRDDVALDRRWHEGAICFGVHGKPIDAHVAVFSVAPNRNLVTWPGLLRNLV